MGPIANRIAGTTGLNYSKSDSAFDLQYCIRWRNKFGHDGLTCGAFTDGVLGFTPCSAECFTVQSISTKVGFNVRK